MWVIKLGGSLARSDELSRWLTALEDCAGEQLVLLPGGGEFADLVRDYAACHRLSDRCSHRMALRAMEQYGLMLADMLPLLSPVDRIEDLQPVWNAGGIPLFLPDRMVGANPRIRPVWSVTSDSIAAWLAAQIGASDVLLVKSVQAKGSARTVESLVESDIVDSAFVDFVNPAIRYWWCGPETHSELLSILKHPAGSSTSTSQILF